MKQHAIDGWLLYDFRGSNPVFWQTLGTTCPTSRRNYLWIPAAGEPCLLLHNLDRLEFSGIALDKKIYTTWQELDTALRRLTTGMGRIAMEYSAGGAIPMHSWVDAGTIESIRAMGLEVVSSADLFQAAATAWSAKSLDLHRKACIEVNEIKDLAFAKIAASLLKNEAITEFDIALFIREQFDRRKLYFDHGPIVAVNAHSGDPHFEPSAENHAPIQKGDWILIDLWAKYHDPDAIYCDITWVGFAGTQPSDKHQAVFNHVTGARDAVVQALENAWKNDTTVQGWQMDRVARTFIEETGYGPYFSHRTGHSMGISPTAHALGVNLDDLETHDTRAILPGVGFSVEPGIYLDDFGVRSEIDMYMDPQNGPTVTSSIQHEIICLEV